MALKRGMTIRTKIWLLLAGVNLALTALFTTLAYSNERKTILTGIDEKLMAAVTAMIPIFPDRYHACIENANSISDEEYARFVQVLTGIADQNDLLYLYTYMQIDGQVVTTATSATPEELAQDAVVPFFEPYTPSEKMQRAFAERRIYYDEIRDEFGHNRSIFVPVITSNDKVFLAGADVTIAFIHDRLRVMLLTHILLGVVAFAMALLVSTWVASRLSEPLTRLIHLTRSLPEQEFALTQSARDQLDTLSHVRRDEVAELAGAFFEMDRTLQLYLDDLKQTTAAKERIESELNVANRIQMSFLPKIFPPFPNRSEFDLYARLKPAREVGGDLYDFHLLDDKRLYFCVGDVSGKGVPAALFMTVTKTLMRLAAQHATDPASALERVNKDLAQDNVNMMFVTLFCGILDFTTGDLVYSNAGHNPPLWMKHGAEPGWLELPSGLVAGALADQRYQNLSVTLAPGDRLLVYTDGVTEAENAEDEMFGDDRLKEKSEPLTEKTPRELVETLLQEVETFSKDVPQSDDITLLAIWYRGEDAVS